MATFKARARTLEMLGKQQIAGIPTAISELFKNAHDAYADNVEVDFIRYKNIFILRDDGLGMTKEDFENRWLTIGTESKLDAGMGISPPYIDTNLEKRPILGEKGIGRLAIATIGPQVLVLSRAKRNNQTQNVVAAFINWELFGIPGIDLDEINVPMRIFSNGTLPDDKDILDMVEEVISNVKNLHNNNKISDIYYNNILDNLNKFSINPLLINKSLGKPNLLGTGHGTHFYITPTDDQVSLAIDTNKSDDSASPLVKFLIGFTNTMTPNAIKPRIKASFRDHRQIDYPEDLINEKIFFTEEDFSKADHYIKGKINEYGQFNGTITIYGDKEYKYTIDWKKNKSKIDCGYFDVNIAYLQGRDWESRISTEDFNEIRDKLNKIGGLYIYRDGIRVLPYGNSDYDFLDFEKERSKTLGEFPFSYRRIFGVVNITKDTNNNLIEKAGREGFIENKAYKQFKDILKNIFKQIAADFFRDDTEYSKYFQSKKKEYKKLHDAKLEADKKSQSARKEFKKQLELRLINIKNQEPYKETAILLDSLKIELKSIFSNNPINNTNELFLDIESHARKELEKIKSKYILTKPIGVAIGKNLEYDWEFYQERYEELESNCFNSASNEIEQIVTGTANEYNIKISKLQRIQRAIDDTVKDIDLKIDIDTEKAKTIIKKIDGKILDLNREVKVNTKEKLNQTINELYANSDNLDDNWISTKKTELEYSIIKTAKRNEKILKAILNQLETIKLDASKSGEIITPIDIKEAYEDELLYLKNRTDIDLELSQLGMAIGIIHHEFYNSVRLIKENIRRLKAWSDVNKDLYPLYHNLQVSFEHLDGYLTLLTPLNRRLYKIEIEISGSSIREFLLDIFVEKLKNENITIEVTKSFINKKIIGYPSTFYPVFVNIVDNAIYWLKDSQSPKIILLDADEKGFFISNNGPEISPRDNKIIFEQGFTRKPNGRGLGLYISKEVLKKINYKLYVDKPQNGMNVTFKIEQNIKKIGVGNDRKSEK